MKFKNQDKIFTISQGQKTINKIVKHALLLPKVHGAIHIKRSTSLYPSFGEVLDFMEDARSE